MLNGSVNDEITGFNCCEPLGDCKFEAKVTFTTNSIDNGQLNKL